ncbi:MAG: hypothetical protein GDA56_10215 [Hormoscilla sp. GM7CHS1pb]|nr:hypothetical protein [Hormoscilla sp. GM7CHS1pb]
MTEENNDELKNLIESNARAIAALKDSLAEFKEIDRQAKQEMADLRETLASLAETQGNALANVNNALANLAKAQADTTANTYKVINKLDNRQGEIVDILKLLVEKNTGKQSGG